MTPAFVKSSRFSVHLCLCEIACLLNLSRFQQLSYVLLKIFVAATLYFATFLPPVSNGLAANKCSCPIFTPTTVPVQYSPPLNVPVQYSLPLHVPVQYSPPLQFLSNIHLHYMFLSNIHPPPYIFLSNIYPHYVFMSNIHPALHVPIHYFTSNTTQKKYYRAKLFIYVPSGFLSPITTCGLCHMVGLKYSQGIL